MSLRPTIELNRGSDLSFPVFWPSAPESSVGMDMTGRVVDAFEPSPALADHLTLTLVNLTGAQLANPATWQIMCRIEWQDDMPSGAIMEFAIRVTLGADNITTPKLTVLVK